MARTGLRTELLALSLGDLLPGFQRLRHLPDMTSVVTGTRWTDAYRRCTILGAPRYSMTSPARASSANGTLRPAGVLTSWRIEVIESGRYTHVAANAQVRSCGIRRT